MIIGIPLGIKKYNRTFDAKLVDSQVTVEEKLLEKDMIINDLTNQINELKTTRMRIKIYIYFIASNCATSIFYCISSQTF